MALGHLLQKRIHKIHDAFGIGDSMIKEESLKSEMIHGLRFTFRKKKVSNHKSIVVAYLNGRSFLVGWSKEGAKESIERILKVNKKQLR